MGGAVGAIAPQTGLAKKIYQPKTVSEHQKSLFEG
jgi:hypothetical protein